MNKRKINIGIFITVAAVIMGTFIFFVGDLSRLFTQPGYPLHLYFDSAAGLEKVIYLFLYGPRRTGF